MAKFIIEVSDDIIRQNASKDNFQPKDGKDVNPMKMLYDLIAFAVIEKKLNEGQTEFYISREDIKDEGSLSIFDRNLPDVCIVAGLSLKNEEKSN